MLERWRRPAVVLDTEHVHQGIWVPDGRVLGEVKLTLAEDTIGRMRAGYMCVKCLEPFEHAWPVRCNVCGAPIRDKQAEYFAKEYAGEERLGGDSLELDGIHERAAREERQ